MINNPFGHVLKQPQAKYQEKLRTLYPREVAFTQLYLL